MKVTPATAWRRPYTLRMDVAAQSVLRIGAWCADPLRGTLTQGSEVVRVDARCMRLLVSLAAHAGQIMSVEKLLDEVWEGVIVSPDSVYQAVASLRRLLRDDPRNPTYIATVPRLGYRMVAEVSVLPEAGHVSPSVGVSSSDPLRVAPREDGSRLPTRLRSILASVFVCVLGALGVIIYALHSGGAAPIPAVAVLPFSDLTSQAMDEEYFADGMTEELIDRLSHVPGLRVRAATSSFALKGKKLSIAAIGKELGVGYVLDGSVRESESTMRITARLARADDGFVIWSQSYDRPTQDKLKIQEDIAREVATSLSGSVKP
jgi:transcriptional activator of cad operon